MRCLEIIAEAVGRAGCSLVDVVKPRIYFRRREHCRQIAKAHGEVFAKIRPADAFRWQLFGIGHLVTIRSANRLPELTMPPQWASAG